jgi:hypothetical protein
MATPSTPRPLSLVPRMHSGVTEHEDRDTVTLNGSVRNSILAKELLCFPEGHLPSSGGRVCAVCHCGELTTSRASREHADEALAGEHGWSYPVNGCAICGLKMKSERSRPWRMFTVLDDGDREVWVCQDGPACSARYEAIRAADIVRVTSGVDGSIQDPESPRLRLVPDLRVPTPRPPRP